MRRNLLILLSLLACWQAGCARVSGSHSTPAPPTAPPSPPTSGDVQVSVTPNPANVRAGSSQQFAAKVTGTTNSSVTWYVNNVAGGDSANGTITSSGNYTAPTILPNPNAQPVTVALNNLSGSFSVDWNVVMAGAVIVALPTALIYILLGRFFVRGLLAGSVKG